MLLMWFGYILVSNGFIKITPKHELRQEDYRLNDSNIFAGDALRLRTGTAQ